MFLDPLSLYISKLAISLSHIQTKIQTTKKKPHITYFAIAIRATIIFLFSIILYFLQSIDQLHSLLYLMNLKACGKLPTNDMVH